MKQSKAADTQYNNKKHNDCYWKWRKSIFMGKLTAEKNWNSNMRCQITLLQINKYCETSAVDSEKAFIKIPFCAI
jgi:hypothetical protein